MDGNVNQGYTSCTTSCVMRTFHFSPVLCFVNVIASDGSLRKCKLGEPTDDLAVSWFTSMRDTWGTIWPAVLREMTANGATTTVTNSEWNGYPEFACLPPIHQTLIFKEEFYVIQLIYHWKLMSVL